MKSLMNGCCRRLPVLLAGGMVLVAGCGNPDAELAAQRQKELETVRAELEQAKSSLAVQEKDLERLRKDNLELLRLRNEVRQLRDDKTQLAKQAQTAQTQAQQAQAQAAAVQTQAQQAAEAMAAQQQAGACVNNLRLIQAAKQQWALAARKDANAVPLPNDLAAFLKGAVIQCPAAGTYSFNAAGAPPTCTISGHALTQ